VDSGVAGGGASRREITQRRYRALIPVGIARVVGTF
jgi:hypothetical protein